MDVLDERLHAWCRVAAVMFTTGWGANQFASLLPVYRRTLRLDEPTLTAIFGVYAIGLAPGFLLGGPASDRYGRRPLVLAFTALSALSSAVLVGGHWSPLGLYAGRLLTGLASGVVFGVGSAWLKELSASASRDAGARRAALSLSAGFGGGPLAAGLLAQWAPAPDVLPYLVHIALAIAAMGLVVGAAETRQAVERTAPPVPSLSPEVRARFHRTVLPVAPWVFGCVTVAFAVLPGRAATLGGRTSPVVTGLLTALTLAIGVGVQPIGRRIEKSAGRSVIAGLAAAAAGMLIAAGGAALGWVALLFTALVLLGAAYGLLIVGGLRDVERLATSETLATLMARYYAVAYLGIFAPYAVSVLPRELGYPVALGLAGVLAAAALKALRRQITAPHQAVG